MAATPNPVERLAALERELIELKRAFKAALAREKILSNRVAALDKTLKSLDTAHTMLRSHVSQLADKKKQVVEKKTKSS